MPLYSLSGSYVSDTPAATAGRYNIWTVDDNKDLWSTTETGIFYNQDGNESGQIYSFFWTGNEIMKLSAGGDLTITGQLTQGGAPSNAQYIATKTSTTAGDPHFGINLSNGTKAGMRGAKLSTDVPALIFSVENEDGSPVMVDVLVMSGSIANGNNPIIIEGEDLKVNGTITVGGNNVLTAESDTLATVTGRGATTSDDVIFSGDITGSARATIGTQLTVGNIPYDTNGILIARGSGRDVLIIQTDSNSADRGLAFRNAGGAYSNAIWVKDVGGGTNDGDLYFSGGNATSTITSLTDHMIISASGNVGIGTDPTGTEKLQVNGGISATTFNGAGTGLTGTAASLNIGGDAGTVNGVNVTNAGTPGGIAYFDSGNDIVDTAAGTNTQILSHNGTVPTWVNQNTLTVGSAGTAGTATDANNVNIINETTSATTHYLAFVDTGGTYGEIHRDTALTYVPDTETLTVTNLAGNATTATNATSFGGVSSATRSQNIARWLGWEHAYNNPNPETVYWDDTEQAIAIDSSIVPDSSIGAAYKAFRIKQGEVYRFTTMIKGSTSSGQGLYIRLYVYNADLPDGKTHISNDVSSGNASTFVTEESPTGIPTGGDFVSNGAVPSSWTNYEYEWTATVDGYVSLVILNWSAFSGILYVKQPDIQKRKSFETITADKVSTSLTFSNTGNGGTSSTTYDGSIARIISYNSIGAAKTDGTNATGTWGINISGNAGSATDATNATNVYIINETTSATTHYLAFVSTGGEAGDIHRDTALTYVPDTETLTVTNLAGNASTATTATTANTWTTSRTLTIGDTGQSVNGGGDVTWTRAQIGITKTNIDALNIDADTLDGVQGSGYLRSNDSDIKSSGTLRFSDSINLAFGNQEDYLIDFNATNLIIHQNVGGDILITDTADTTKYTFDISAGSLTATTFIGALSGNATTATTANTATTATTATNATNISQVNDLTGTRYLISTDASDTNNYPPKVDEHLKWVADSERLEIGDTATTTGEGILRITRSINNGTSDYIQFYDGTTRVGEIGCQDGTWLRINQVTAKNIYTPRYFRADGGLYVDSDNGIRNITGQYGSVQTIGSTGGYHGFSVNGRLVFMENGSGTGGIFDDLNNDWVLQCTLSNGAGTTRLYAGDGGTGGAVKLATVAGSAAAGGVDITGTLDATVDVTVTSDIRLKNELPDTVQGLETVDKLRPIKYTLKSDEDENPKIHLGFSAQELLDIVPEVVKTDEEGYHSVSYQKLVPVLVKAIQELTEEVRELKKKVGE